MRTLALVVPGIDLGGGVPAVAQFLRTVAERDGRWAVRPVSLCMSSSDPESSALLRPGSLVRSPRVGVRSWLGEGVSHVGAWAGEIEFQRYRPRAHLYQLLKGCDVVQVVCGSPAWANAVVGGGRPVSLQVATLARVERRMRDAKALGLSGLWRRAMTVITDRLDERALRVVDAIQVENPWMLEHVRSANADRAQVDVRYAPPGIDAAIFSPASSRNPSTGHILCVGRLDDVRKNIGLLLEAYDLLPDALRERHRLVLAGAGGPSSEFWQRVAELGLGGQVEFVHRPEQSALVALYQQAAAFALPSDEEGLGVVVLEAMACGVPVVCTRSGGPDGIIRDGVDGRLVPLNDARAMAQALSDVLGQVEANMDMGRAARATIERRYSIEAAGVPFLDVWNRLVEGRRL